MIDRRAEESGEVTAVLSLLLVVEEEGLEHMDRVVRAAVTTQGLKRKVLL